LDGGRRVGVIPSLIYLAVRFVSRTRSGRAGINILTAQWSDLVKTAQENRHFAEMFSADAVCHDLECSRQASLQRVLHPITER